MIRKHQNIGTDNEGVGDILDLQAALATAATTISVRTEALEKAKRQQSDLDVTVLTLQGQLVSKKRAISYLRTTLYEDLQTLRRQTQLLEGGLLFDINNTYVMGVPLPSPHATATLDAQTVADGQQEFPMSSRGASKGAAMRKMMKGMALPLTMNSARGAGVLSAGISGTFASPQTPVTANGSSPSLPQQQQSQGLSALPSHIIPNAYEEFTYLDAFKLIESDSVEATEEMIKAAVSATRTEMRNAQELSRDAMDRKLAKAIVELREIEEAYLKTRRNLQTVEVQLETKSEELALAIEQEALRLKELQEKAMAEAKKVFQDQIDEMEQKVKQAAIDSAKALAEAEAMKDDSEAKLADYDAMIVAHKKEVALLRGNISKEREEAIRAQNAAKTAEADREDCDALIKDLRDKLADEKEAGRRMLETVTKVKTELATAQSAASSAASNEYQVQQLTKQVKQAKAQAQTLRESVEELTNHKNVLEGELQDAHESLLQRATTEAELRDTLEKCYDLEAEMKEKLREAGKEADTFLMTQSISKASEATAELRLALAEALSREQQLKDRIRIASVLASPKDQLQQVRAAFSGLIALLPAEVLTANGDPTDPSNTPDRTIRSGIEKLYELNNYMDAATMALLSSGPVTATASMLPSTMASVPLPVVVSGVGSGSNTRPSSANANARPGTPSRSATPVVLAASTGNTSISVQLPEALGRPATPTGAGAGIDVSANSSPRIPSPLLDLPQGSPTGRRKSKSVLPIMPGSPTHIPARYSTRGCNLQFAIPSASLRSVPMSVAASSPPPTASVLNTTDAVERTFRDLYGELSVSDVQYLDSMRMAILMSSTEKAGAWAREHETAVLPTYFATAEESLAGAILSARQSQSEPNTSRKTKNSTSRAHSPNSSKTINANSSIPSAGESAEVASITAAGGSKSPVRRITSTKGRATSAGSDRNSSSKAKDTAKVGSLPSFSRLQQGGVGGGKSNSRPSTATSAKPSLASSAQPPRPTSAHSPIRGGSAVFPTSTGTHTISTSLPRQLSASASQLSSVPTVASETFEGPTSGTLATNTFASNNSLPVRKVQSLSAGRSDDDELLIREDLSGVELRDAACQWEDGIFENTAANLQLQQPPQVSVSAESHSAQTSFRAPNYESVACGTSRPPSAKPSRAASTSLFDSPRDSRPPSAKQHPPAASSSPLLGSSSSPDHFMAPEALGTSSPISGSLSIINAIPGGSVTGSLRISSAAKVLPPVDNVVDALGAMDTSPMGERPSSGAHKRPTSAASARTPLDASMSFKSQKVNASTSGSLRLLPVAPIFTAVAPLMISTAEVGVQTVPWAPTPVFDVLHHLSRLAELEDPIPLPAATPGARPSSAANSSTSVNRFYPNTDRQTLPMGFKAASERFQSSTFIDGPNGLSAAPTRVTQFQQALTRPATAGSNSNAVYRLGTPPIVDMELIAPQRAGGASTSLNLSHIGSVSPIDLRKDMSRKARELASALNSIVNDEQVVQEGPSPNKLRRPNSAAPVILSFDNRGAANRSGVSSAAGARRQDVRTSAALLKPAVPSKQPAGMERLEVGPADTLHLKHQQGSIARDPLPHAVPISEPPTALWNSCQPALQTHWERESSMVAAQMRSSLRPDLNVLGMDRNERHRLLNETKSSTHRRPQTAQSSSMLSRMH